MSWKTASGQGNASNTGSAGPAMGSNHRWHVALDGAGTSKMKKTIAFVLMSMFVATLVWSASVWAARDGNGDSAKVGFSVQNYFSLEVKSGDSVDFGQVDAFGGPYIKKNGTKLKVDTNTTWSLATSKRVLLKPAGAVEGDVLNALRVDLETASGAGSDSDIKVDYTLSNLGTLPSGDYVIEVVFTGTAN